ncbi:MAG: porin [Bacteroidetes bacterium]|nr:MAG: porin [Bacteroidota bacterium]
MLNATTLKLCLLGLLLSCYTMVQAQDKATEEDTSYKPLKLNLSEDGKKYVRFIIWHQQWAQTNNLSGDDNLQVSSFTRRSRMLAYAQISSRFLLLTHFGLNNLSTANMTSFGNSGDGPQFFLHDAWTEFKASNDDALYLGTGLHYWKGLTRLANQSTLNFMTLDNSRPFVHWHSIGVTDQFARHMGVYAKGQLGNFDYRLAINNPLRNGIQVSYLPKNGLTDSLVAYNGFNVRNADQDRTGNTIIEGYFRYQFGDKESIKLPYQVGTYLGAKKVIGLGAGFFAHPNGVYRRTSPGGPGQHENVSHFAVDVFVDMPLGTNDCLNAYAAYMNFNYGDNFVSRWAGTGSVLYAHVGYKLPGSKFMPYISVQSANYDAWEENVGALDIGLNYFLNGHNAKITLEYHQITNDIREGAITDFDANNTLSQIRLQTHIFL